MRSMENEIYGSAGRSSNMMKVYMETDGVYVSLQCQACKKTFECYQTSIAGVAIGRHVCPQCLNVNHIRPEDFEAALDRHLPELSIDEMIRLSEEATRITETWYRLEPFAKLLNYRGVNLGEGPERILIAFVVQGLYMAIGEKGEK